MTDISAEAMVAAAYEDAAEAADEAKRAYLLAVHNYEAVASQGIAKCIRARTPDDARAALDRVKEEVRQEEREACAAFLREYADNFPVGAEDRQLGSSSYNWFRRAEKVLSERNAEIREGRDNG